MKKIVHGLGLAMVAGMMAVPAYAAVEMTETTPAGKTLADFKQEYSGTKPVVAWNKFWEYQMLQKAPRPTLATTALRTAPGEKAHTGSKPVLRMLQSK